ncbi:MAG: peptidoglycan DD-metalloendopeptidase family protein, partial [Christensenellales bacterium]
MEKNNSEKWAKVKTFFKKNGYYFLIVLCIGAVATMVGVAVSQSKKGQDANISIVDDSQSTIVGEQDKPQDEGEKPSEPDEPVNPTEPEKEKTVFTVPVSGSVSNEYSASSVFYNQSLNKYQTHEAMDFVSETDSNVYASADGKVTEIDYNMLDGYYVVLEHADGIVTRYCSLSGETTLNV